MIIITVITYIFHYGIKGPQQNAAATIIGEIFGQLFHLNNYTIVPDRCPFRP